MTKMFSAPLPRKTIAYWYGSEATIPFGWAKCDGTNGTPNMQNVFVYGSTGFVPELFPFGETPHTHAIPNLGTGTASALTMVNKPPNTTAVAGQNHGHRLNGFLEEDFTLPPYYALIPIMKTA